MNVSRIIEVRMFDSLGTPTFNYDIDVSTNLMSKKWPKFVYRVLRECLTVCMQGGAVVMRGTLIPRV